MTRSPPPPASSAPASVAAAPLSPAAARPRWEATQELTDEARVAPSAAKAWLLATRPKTLPAAIVPVLVGVGCAARAGEVSVAPSLAALAGALLLQIGSNFANDVYDYEKGADDHRRVGPTRAVQAGWITARRMKLGMGCVFAAALLVGVYLTLVAGPLIVGIGLTSIVAAIAYTGGPYPLGYNGLGELFVMLFFGVVAVCGTEFVNTGQSSPLALLCALAVGALASSILVVNNLRDEATDRTSGKRTLIVRFGRRAGVLEYHALLSLAFALPLAAFVLGWGGPWLFLPWAALPLALRNARSVARQGGAALNPVLAHTALLLLSFGVLLSVGLFAGASAFTVALW